MNLYYLQEISHIRNQKNLFHPIHLKSGKRIKILMKDKLPLDKITIRKTKTIHNLTLIRKKILILFLKEILNK